MTPHISSTLQDAVFKGSIINITMARKDSIKTYVKNGYYHVYNRGASKQKIFKGRKDHNVFLSYLKAYLSAPQKPSKFAKTFTVKNGIFKGIPRLPKNYHSQIDLVAYCLMPNHFHLLLKQNNLYSMKEFLHSLSIRYSMYFNKRHDRLGPLFQGRYKAKLITKDNYLLHLSRYIHLNPRGHANNLISAYSSFADYVGLRNTSWVKPDVIMKFFKHSTIPELKKVSSYKDFVEKSKKDSAEILGNLILE